MLTFARRHYLGRPQATPFVKWVGGKRASTASIVQLAPDNVDRYWEPFVGGGAIFFALDNRLEEARLSDVNTELMLAYWAVKDATGRVDPVPVRSCRAAPCR